MKKVAIIGTGIAGLTAAHKLRSCCDLQLFEANHYIGGHTNTIKVQEGDKELNIDTGFIVFNHWTYPNFIELMQELDVEWQDSAMSFSVKCDESGLEYNGTNINSLFAQRRNLFKPRFWQMISDIIRFNKTGLKWLQEAEPNDSVTLGQFIKEGAYGSMFRNNYILPMTAAVWSAGHDCVMNFPLRFFLNFFKNHGFLNVEDRPTWRVIKGGSNSYIPKITAGLEDRIHLNTPIERVERRDNKVEITSKLGVQTFDAVIFACHSDQALKMLAKPTTNESEILGALPYQRNEAILHWDESVLPQRKLAQAAWNYHLDGTVSETAKLTYSMNILQSLDSQKSYNVSLNYDRIDPEKIIKKIIYHHPVFTLDGVKAQKRHSEISGHNNSFYAGAYWRFGFHEDGVVSGLRAAEQVKERFQDE